MGVSRPASSMRTTGSSRSWTSDRSGAASSWSSRRSTWTTSAIWTTTSRPRSSCAASALPGSCGRRSGRSAWAWSCMGSACRTRTWSWSRSSTRGTSRPRSSRRSGTGGSRSAGRPCRSRSGRRSTGWPPRSVPRRVLGACLPRAADSGQVRLGIGGVRRSPGPVVHWRVAADRTIGAAPSVPRSGDSAHVRCAGQPCAGPNRCIEACRWSDPARRRTAVPPRGSDPTSRRPRRSPAHARGGCCTTSTGEGSLARLPIGEVLECASAAEWEAWLEANHASAREIWLRLAKKGSGRVTVSRAEALEVALCYGWIDGQSRTQDETYWLQRFTPRSPRSKWSKVNCELAERLIAEGRMKPPGLAAVEAAGADGGWDAAYDPPSRIAVPEDLLARLKESPAAHALFERLDSRNRYAILYRIADAKRPDTRARRIEKFVSMLER